MFIQGERLDCLPIEHIIDTIYVNMLCHEVWKNKKTTKQKNILKALALQPTIEPTGHAFVNLSNMPTSSISQTMKALINKDMVYRVKKVDGIVPGLEIGQLRVLDPLLAYALKKYA